MYSFKTIYKFKCSDCGKEKTTTKEERAKIGTCQKCLSLRVPEDQMSLFGDVNNTVNTVDNNHER